MRKRRSLVSTTDFGVFWKLIHTHFALLRKSRTKTICCLASGLLMRARIGLAEIARGMRDDTTVRHRIKRAWRFLRNDDVSCEDATTALSRWIFSGSRATAVVALDWTDWGEYMLLAAKVAVDGRAVPLAWMVMRKHLFDRDRKSRNDMEEKLIFRLKETLRDRPWVLVADRGFARADLFRALLDWKVSFVIRATCNTWVRVYGFSGILANIPRRPNAVHRYAKAFYHKTRRIPVGLAVTHEEPAPEPWYLITSPDQTERAVATYRKRMWIEEGFRDAKSNLGLTRFWAAKPERMERMMILVAIVMLVAILTALEYRRRNGNRDPQLTTKRRGRCLSLFRLGMELLWLHGIPPNLARVQILARTVARPLPEKEA
jgi:hypothetical protein